MVDIRVAPGRAHCERKRVADSVRCKQIHDQEILSYPIPIFLLNLGVLLGLFDFSVAGARANKLEKQGPVEQLFSGKNPKRTSFHFPYGVPARVLERGALGLRS